MATDKVKAELFDLQRRLSNDPCPIDSLIQSLNTTSPSRFKTAKELQLISQIKPEDLYPHFHVFSSLLDGKSSVLLWNAIIILSWLATVDRDKLFDAVLDRYYKHLWDGKLVTTANILASSGRIINARPDLAGIIIPELLLVDVLPVPTAECREVARGAVLDALSESFDYIKADPPVLDFIRSCSLSHRNSVRQRALALKDKIIEGKPGLMIRKRLT